MKGKGLKGNVVTYTALISAFCGENNIDKAMQYFDEMLSSGCSPDAIVYYSLISGLTIAGRMDDASVVVSQLKRAGFGLDRACYNVLISGFCKKKKLERVYEMLNEMEETGVKPDTVTYNTLVSYLGKAGDFATASKKVLRKEKCNYYQRRIVAERKFLKHVIQSSIDSDVDYALFKAKTRDSPSDLCISKAGERNLSKDSRPTMPVEFLISSDAL
ncbi:hypothetical protein KIW84_020908 [Lathyrus oleraceus]|uniref:Pentatricopeptide repeat-containing protein n=1 Tax=Pisum sativum TaxID=3888 RepID=A0A9D5B8K3_PEA|nr:hypothetical protein KIW84_020908 [Pisum sativum]